MAIYAVPRGALRTGLVRTLRESHAGRLPRARGSSRFTGVQNMTPIGLRPPELDQRLAPGHWEADLIKGSRNGSAVGILIERTSRYVMFAELDGFDAQSVLEGSPCVCARTRQPAPGPYLQPGHRDAPYETLAKRLKMGIHFCDPHSRWQRAANENASGLICDYLAKGTDLNTVTNAELRAIEAPLNGRPRQTLTFQTPDEVFPRLRLNELMHAALEA